MICPSMFAALLLPSQAAIRRWRNPNDANALRRPSSKEAVVAEESGAGGPAYGSKSSAATQPAPSRRGSRTYLLNGPLEVSLVLRSHRVPSGEVKFSLARRHGSQSGYGFFCEDTLIGDRDRVAQPDYR